MFKKTRLLLICLTMILSLASCGEAQLPQLTPLKKGEDIAVITTNMGVIKIRFFPKVAPFAVENFITHAKNGYYDGVIFHRVMKDFMIQAGDPEGTGMGGESIWGYGFDIEVDVNVRHFKGAVGMANTGQPNSNGSQFYIVQNGELDRVTALNMDDMRDEQNKISGKDANGKVVRVKDTYPTAVINEYLKSGGAHWLDFDYTVFAQVYEGLDIVDAIANVKVDESDPNSPKPLEDVVIESITIEKYQ